MKFQIGRDTWEEILVPNVKFRHVGKETGCHGVIYAAYTSNTNIVWVSQSVTSLCKMISLKCNCKCFSSSFYRYLRGVMRKPANKWWRVKKVPDAEALNEVTAPYEFFQVCSKNLNLWELASEVSEVSEALFVVRGGSVVIEEAHQNSL
jgi:hypothetical protein